ncbi:MAG: ATP-binding protein [Candidatus Levyibacteriota bacterium]
MVHLQEKQIIEHIIAAIGSKTESDLVEFKDARSGIPTDLWKAITAFSNSPGGGMVVFGVSESTQHPRNVSIVGKLDLATLQEKIVSLMEQKIANRAEYSLKIVKCEGHELLVLLVDETPKENKPCYCTDLGMDRGACVRSGNANRQITEEELRAFLRYTPAYNYDKRALEQPLSILSEDKIQTYLDKSAVRTKRIFPAGTNDLTVQKNLGIIAEYDGTRYPTLAGTMIFSSEPPQQIDELSRYIIRCVRYAGSTTSSSIIDKADIYGTLDFQVDEVLKFILRNIRTEAKIVGSKRVETPEYPELALREVIVNAVVHRDYSNKGTYVQVTIFSNRIEVSNPGTLPPGVTIENLKNAQFSRNDVIAKIMRDLDYMEEFGRGIDLIYSKMAEWELVEPIFKNVSNTFKVTLLGKKFKELSERQVMIWAQLQDKSQITAGVVHSLLRDLSRATINNDLKKMVELGYLEIRGTSNNISYILSPKT